MALAQYTHTHTHTHHVEVLLSVTTKTNHLELWAKVLISFEGDSLFIPSRKCACFFSAPSFTHRRKESSSIKQIASLQKGAPSSEINTPVFLLLLQDSVDLD